MSDTYKSYLLAVLC
ncbi:DUF1270 family protein, partial [Staphylococcus aureus]